MPPVLGWRNLFDCFGHFASLVERQSRPAPAASSFCHSVLCGWRPHSGFCLRQQTTELFLMTATTLLELRASLPRCLGGRASALVRHFRSWTTHSWLLVWDSRRQCSVREGGSALCGRAAVRLVREGGSALYGQDHTLRAASRERAGAAALSATVSPDMGSQSARVALTVQRLLGNVGKSRKSEPSEVSFVLAP